MEKQIKLAVSINGKKAEIYVENGSLYVMSHTAAWGAPAAEVVEKPHGWKRAAALNMTTNRESLTLADLEQMSVRPSITAAIGTPCVSLEQWEGPKFTRTKDTSTEATTTTPEATTPETVTEATEAPTATEATTPTLPTTTTPTEAPATPSARPTNPTTPATSANDVLGGLAAYLSAQIKTNNDELAADIINKVMAAVRPEIERIAETKVARVDVTTHRGTHRVEGKTHKDFARVLKLISLGLNVYLYGPAGTGKTTLARQIAEAFGLPFYTMGAAATKYDYTGFVDAGGRPVETPLKKAARDGGVILLDEIDGSMPEALLPINALRDRQPVEMAGEMIYPHKDFVMICAGNTIGTGATEEYNGRQQQDSAFLNGFAKVALNYDPAIELAMANNDSEIVEFVHDLRNSAKVCGLAIVVSPRDINRLAVINEAFPGDHVNTLATATFEGTEQDTLRTLYNNLTDKRNVWARALQTLIVRAA